ncbi:MAG: flagellar basal body protein, partial [Verrucomicrobiota bacterium]
MLGLIGSLRMGTRSLAAQRQGVEVIGHNLANVNNTA